MTTTPPPITTPDNRIAAPRWMKVLLGLSLAANLAVVGVVAGAILKDGPPRRDPIVKDLGFGPFTDALTKEDRQALRDAFAQKAPDFRDKRLVIRQEAEALLAALRADPFDQAALRDLMQRQHLRMAERFEVGRVLLVDRIAAMTQDERVAFAERLEQGLKRGPKHGKDGGHGDPGDGPKEDAAGD